METKKLLIMSDFAYNYMALVANAYDYYDAFCNPSTDDESERKLYAINALCYATRANTTYDCAFYTRIKGLPTNLLDTQKIVRDKIDFVRDSSTSMDTIVRETIEYLRKCEN